MPLEQPLAYRLVLRERIIPVERHVLRAPREPIPPRQVKPLVHHVTLERLLPRMQLLVQPVLLEHIVPLEQPLAYRLVLRESIIPVAVLLVCRAPREPIPPRQVKRLVLPVPLENTVLQLVVLLVCLVPQDHIIL